MRSEQLESCAVGGFRGQCIGKYDILLISIRQFYGGLGVVDLRQLFLLGIAVDREFIGQFNHLESSWLTGSGGWGLYHV